MNHTVIMIKELRSKIDKLEKDFKKGVPPYQGFTIDISYGGNTHHDVKRICVGSISDEEKSSETFYNLILNSLKNSLKYWEKIASDELKELSIILAKNNP